MNYNGHRVSSVPLVFLIGSPRSGTTWLANCLNSSPHIAYCHEPIVHLDSSTVGELNHRYRSLDRDACIATLRREWTKAWGDTDRPPFFSKDFKRGSPVLRWTLWVASRRSAAMRRLCEAHWSLDGCEDFTLLAKLRPHGGLLRYLSEFLRPPTILLLRNPISTIASIVRGLKLGLMGELPSRDQWWAQHGDEAATHGYSRKQIESADDITVLAIEWYLENARYETYVKQNEGSQVVLYERFKSSPRRACESLLKSIGLPITRQTERFIQKTTAAGLFHLPDSGHSYFSIYRSPRQPTLHPRDILSPEEQQVISEICRPLLSKYWPDCGSL